jgi:hypothetical protein
LGYLRRHGRIKVELLVFPEMRRRYVSSDANPELRPAMPRPQYFEHLPSEASFARIRCSRYGDEERGGA